MVFGLFNTKKELAQVHDEVDGITMRVQVMQNHFNTLNEHVLQLKHEKALMKEEMTRFHNKLKLVSNEVGNLLLLLQGVNLNHTNEEEPKQPPITPIPSELGVGDTIGLLQSTIERVKKQVAESVKAINEQIRKELSDADTEEEEAEADEWEDDNEEEDEDWDDEEHFSQGY